MTETTPDPLRFDPDKYSHIVVDGPNAEETWTTAQWNEYIDRCKDPDTGGAIIFRVVRLIPAERGFKVGDVVQITGRGLEHDGHIAEGQIGYVTELDDNPEYSIGLTVEGFLGLVWCNSAEIRHYGEGPEFPSAEARDEHLEAVARGEAGADR